MHVARCLVRSVKSVLRALVQLPPDLLVIMSSHSTSSASTQGILSSTGLTRKKHPTLDCFGDVPALSLGWAPAACEARCAFGCRVTRSWFLSLCADSSIDTVPPWDMCESSRRKYAAKLFRREADEEQTSLKLTKISLEPGSAYPPLLHSFGVAQNRSVVEHLLEPAAAIIDSFMLRPLAVFDVDGSASPPSRHDALLFPPLVIAQPGKWALAQHILEEAR